MGKTSSVTQPIFLVIDPKEGSHLVYGDSSRSPSFTTEGFCRSQALSDAQKGKITPQQGNHVCVAYVHYLEAGQLSEAKTILVTDVAWNEVRSTVPSAESKTEVRKYFH